MSLAKTFGNQSQHWNTPPRWWDWACRTLRRDPSEIFDPCPATWQPGDPSGLDIPWEPGCITNYPGGRNRFKPWWVKFHEEHERVAGIGRRLDIVWVMFNIEQMRHAQRIERALGLLSFRSLDGWLVLPDDRTPFVWGGPDLGEKRDKDGKVTQKERKHGEPAEHPGNWSAFWTNMPPATPPESCDVWRTPA